MFDDFHEREPDTAIEAQNSLRLIYESFESEDIEMRSRTTSGYDNSQTSNNRHKENRSNHVESLITQNDESTTIQHNENTSRQPSKSSKDPKATENQGVSLEEGDELSQLWIIPCFHYAKHGARAMHLEVALPTFDADLFLEFRKQYFKQRSRFSRFFALKEVGRISFVTVSQDLVR